MAKEKPKHIVGYLRTSTDEQLLGIDAQQDRLAAIAEERQCDITRVFTEHESGGDNSRPELGKALAHARRIKGYLVVAKLDRLARDSAFLMSIYDGKVPVIFGDLPEVDGSAASRLMVQMMANIAEFERRRIGERIKEALAVLKRQGRKLGTPRNLTGAHRLKGSRKAAQERRARAIAEMADVAPIAARLRREGCSFRHIAATLNTEGYLTRMGKDWTATQVKRVIDRLTAS